MTKIEKKVKDLENEKVNCRLQFSTLFGFVFPHLLVHTFRLNAVTVIAKRLKA